MVPTESVKKTAVVAKMVLLSWFLAYNSPLSADSLAACPQVPKNEVSEPPVPLVVGEQLFNELIAWIAINTSYDLSVVYNDPPTISFCQTGELIEYEHKELLVDTPLLAVFDREQRHIFLRQPWTFLDYFDQSILLHELIHDVQLQNRDWDCTGSPELEAYLLQDKWLFEKGIRYNFDWAMIRQLSDCDDQ